MRSYALLLWWVFFPGLLAFGQQQISWRTDNYAGINAVFLNPAAAASFPLKWDLNIIEGGQFFDNNYGYLRNTNLLQLYQNRNTQEFVFGPDLRKDPAPISPNAVVADFYEDEKKRYLAAASFVTGPSFLLRFKENHFAGFFARGRLAFGSQDIPAPFSYYQYDARKFFEPFRVDLFQGTAMGWAEYGLTYTYKKVMDSGSLSLGGNLKLLRGYEAAYFQINGAFDFEKLPGDSISGSLANIAFGLTTSAVNDGENFKPKVNGKGFGLDLGVVYSFDNQGNTEKPYELKLGFSILDIGSIRFSKNAEKHLLQTGNQVIVGAEAYEKLSGPESLDEAIKIFSLQVLQDSFASKTADEFTMWLPGALSLQADYALNNFLFVNATLVQRIPYKAPSPEAGNLFALTPRYEHRWFGAALPMVFYNWQDFRMGATIRLAFLTLGTENLGSLVGKSNLSGTDFFFALKFNPFQIHIGEDSLSGPKRGRGKVKCYKF